MGGGAVRITYTHTHSYIYVLWYDVYIIFQNHSTPLKLILYIVDVMLRLTLITFELFEHFKALGVEQLHNIYILNNIMVAPIHFGAGRRVLLSFFCFVFAVVNT